METLAGMPGTISADAVGIRWYRGDDVAVCPGVVGRSYRADRPDGALVAVVGKEPVERASRPLWHISISHRNASGEPDRCPTWDELKHAAYRLVPDDVPLVLIFPRRSTPKDRYVDLYPTCLHLWESEYEVGC